MYIWLDVSDGRGDFTTSLAAACTEPRNGVNKRITTSQHDGDEINILVIYNQLTFNGLP